MRTLLIALAVVLAFASISDAATLYEYTGNQFTTVGVGGSCQGDCALSFSFVLETALPANLSTTLGFVSAPFVASDGVTVYNSALEPAHLDDHFRIFATDAAGLPSVWAISIEVFRAGGVLDSFGTSNDADGIAHRCCDLSMNGRGELLYNAFNQGVPGTWRAIVVPEPMTLLLVGIGLAGLAGARRRVAQ